MPNQAPSPAEILRHSTAHVLAAAILQLFPETKYATGPATDDGFYYDFEFKKPLSPDDFKQIEKAMRALVNKKVIFEKQEKSLDEAREIFKKLNQPYKLELINKIEKEEQAEKVTLYKTGDFVDLCRGPHLKDAGEIAPDAFKLTRMAGAYWLADEKNQMLTRIYGVVFEKKDELKKYVNMLAEAEKRNHRKIGKEMELFANFPEIGQGLPVWLPKGYAMRRVLEDYMLKLERSYDYEHILTPHINKQELFEKSGHLGFYTDSMYSPLKIDDETFYLKPMNCPAGIMVYAMKPRSYRELPLKIGELGTVYRYEQSGELHGLQRVRGFTQNDAHIYCTPEQLRDQFMEVFEMLEKFMGEVGFTDYKYRLSLGDKNDPDKYVGDPKKWDEAEAVMRETLKKNGKEFYEAPGEAAFYGPKVDFQAINVFGKEDSIGTVQIDFNLPERFELSYVDKDGKKQQPYVIHRALIGSFERFFAFLIEHYGGNFPLWFAPTQIIILPVSEKFNTYAKEIYQSLKQEDWRVEMDDADESLGKKIKLAQKKRAPYILIVGEKEKEAEGVAVRSRGKGDEGLVSLEKFKERVKKEIEEKK